MYLSIVLSCFSIYAGLEKTIALTKKLDEPAVEKPVEDPYLWQKALLEQADMLIDGLTVKVATYMSILEKARSFEEGASRLFSKVYEGRDGEEAAIQEINNLRAHREKLNLQFRCISLDKEYHKELGEKRLLTAYKARETAYTQKYTMDIEIKAFLLLVHSIERKLQDCHYLSNRVQEMQSMANKQCDTDMPEIWHALSSIITGKNFNKHCPAKIEDFAEMAATDGDVPLIVKQIALPQIDGAIHAVCIANDGKRALVAYHSNGDSLGYSFDLSDTQKIESSPMRGLRMVTGDVKEFYPSSDGTTCSIRGTFNVGLYEGNEVIRVNNLKQIKDVTPPICCMAVSENGQYALFAGYNGSVAHVDWHMVRKVSRNLNGHSNDCVVTCCSISSDGTTAVTAGGNELLYWLTAHEPNVTPKKLQLPFFVQALSLASKAPTVLFGGENTESGRVCLWQIEGEPRTYELPTAVTATALLSNGSLGLVGCKNGGLSLWNITKQELSHSCELKGHDSKIKQLYLADDGFVALSRDEEGKVFLWNLADKTTPKRYALHEKVGKLTAIYMSASGNNVIGGNEQGNTYVWVLTKEVYGKEK